jgi:hypothetical protein
MLHSLPKGGTRSRERAGERVCRARGYAGPRGLRPKPVPLPPGRAATGSLIAEHEEREW